MKTSQTHVDHLSDFTTDSRMIVLSLLASFIGCLGAGAAYALIWLIGTLSNLFFFQEFSSVLRSPATNHLGWIVVAVPIFGGLIIGLMARFGSSKIRGHGIPEALEAILLGQSRIELKVALLKPISSAISIGTGGPFGAEGPIIMTGGALGSLFAQLFRLSSAERKALLVAGAAAGMSAVFATPTAAILLAVELLLFEWKPRSFIPVAVASTTAFVVRQFLMGTGPIFPIPPHHALQPICMAAALLLGLLTGFVSGGLTKLVYLFEDVFLLIPIHWMWWPMIGGLFVGLGGYADPRVLGVGYELIHSLLRGEVVGAALVGLLLGKAVVWSIALGSGTSGGVLAPLLMMGGAVGALCSQWIPVGDTALWAMTGMAAIMGGTMRSPLTAVIFTVELTNDFNTLPALLIACVASEAVTVLLLRRSILTEKIARRGHHLIREYSVDPLQLVRVREVMDTNPLSVPPDMEVADLADRMAKYDPDFSKHHAFPIVDSEYRLVGIITRGDVLRAMSLRSEPSLTVLEAGSDSVITVHADDVLASVLTKMWQHEIGRVVVVSTEDPNRMIGYLGRPDILRAKARMHEEEHTRTPGKLGKLQTFLSDMV